MSDLGIDWNLLGSADYLTSIGVTPDMIASPPGTPTPTPAPTPTTNPGTQTTNPQSVIEQAKSLFPWLGQMGVTPEDFAQWIGQEGLDATGIVAKVRTLPQYKARFPAITRTDGTMRSNEAQYLATEDDLRNVLKQSGRSGYDNPSDLAAFFEQGIKPDELDTRLKTYDDIERNGQFTKNAFYVYAGLNPSTDDLYQAAVDPAARQRLVDSYNQAVATDTPDYTTWITRATQAGLATVSDTVQRLENQGVLPAGSAAKALSQLDPNQARQVMDALYHGGSATGPFLNLDELTHAFQYATIGSAATQQGLQLTDQGMVEQLRQAGVSRAQALSTYGNIANNQNLFNSELQRSGQNTFTQQDFEKALFLNGTDQTAALTKAADYEKSLGSAGGGASFSSSGGRLKQQGLDSNPLT